MGMDEFEYENIKCRVLVNSGRSNPLILLHGYSFTIDVWREINLITYLESKNVPYIALDMPYGLKSKCSSKNMDPEFNVSIVEYVYRKYGFDMEPIILGASLGGYIALRYALKYPTLGLILIALVRTFEEQFRKLQETDMPILVIYGTNDKIVTLNELQDFVSGFKNGRLKIYEGAGHPAYLDKPEMFKEDVYSFYNEITQG